MRLEEEIFSLEEMVKIWNPANINKSPAIFDTQKLTAINAAYIRALPAEKFAQLAAPWLDKAVQSKVDRTLLCANLQPRCEFLADIPPRVAFIDTLPDYELELFENKKQKTTPDTAREALTAILAVLEPLQAWNKDAIFEACRAKAEAMEKKNGWLMYPLGIALAGQRSTPGGGTDLAAMLGKEKTLQRIRLALEKLG